MSKPANGVISGGGVTFDATFTIDGHEYKFSGGFNGVSVPIFISSNAVLTYAKTDDLSGPMQFEGDLGVKAVTMNMDKGIMISAPLDKALDRAYTITGNGSWHFSRPPPTAPQAAKGLIHGTGDGFLATFIIDGRRYLFEGGFNGVSEPSFRSSNAVLCYLKTEDLVGVMQFQGDLGIKTIAMNMEKGIIIAGPLDDSLVQSNPVVGKATWRSS